MCSQSALHEEDGRAETNRKNPPAICCFFYCNLANDDGPVQLISRGELKINIFEKKKNWKKSNEDDSTSVWIGPSPAERCVKTSNACIAMDVPTRSYYFALISLPLVVVFFSSFFHPSLPPTESYLDRCSPIVDCVHA